MVDFVLRKSFQMLSGDDFRGRHGEADEEVGNGETIAGNQPQNWKSLC